MKPNHDRPTVLIADDHTVVAEGLSVALSAHYTVVGQVTVLDRLLEAIRDGRPDVVILDLAFGGNSSLPVLQEATADASIHSRFVVLTAHDSRALSAAAFKAGASAYLLKGASTHELRLAIDAALEGCRFTPEEGRDGNRQIPESPLGPSVEIGGASLRPRQVHILNLLLDGLNRKAIARKLGISIKGVDYHIAATCKAVGTPNLRLLSLWAVEHPEALRSALKGKGDSARLMDEDQKRSQDA